ncbi:hypothetical protein FHL15_007814 [Xylaria flabelliformis]|uniref:Histidine kinase n=1 Tax=Xylaria flabelliformis TaxID=2512241 RepID=A0A553HTC4_9PEZI|nr:hypothetical protein FHL15_007814 [Xylaria flabelliformis]
MGDIDTADLWDLSPVPTLVLSPACRIERVSNGFLDLWKRQREEFVGKDVFNALYAGSLFERFDRIPLTRSIEVAIDTRKVQLCYSACSVDGTSWSARVIPIFKNDKLLALVLGWELVENSLGDAAVDLAHNMLSADETFRLLIQAVKDYAIFLLDTRGYVATWNAGAELLKGYERTDIIGKHFSTFYGEEDLRAGKPERELEICLRDGRAQDEGWRYRKDGSRFWANVVITTVYRNGVHVGFGKVTRDLTERRNAELQLVQAYEESAKLKNDFLANMSHEIRTPLHGMLSACTLLLDTALTPNQRDMADLIAESGQVLLQVINSILDYSKIVSGSVSMSSVPVDIAGIMSSVIRNVQVRLRPEVHLQLDLSPELPKAIKGDPLRFRQIVQNIVDNAVKFTEEGWVSVQTSVVAEDETTCTIQTNVTDTGIGVQVTDATVQNLYKPFIQLEQSINKRFQGTGLGLSIAKSLVELMDGQLGYRPNPTRHGSVFWFTAKFTKIPEKNVEHETSLQLRLKASDEDASSILQRLREIAPRKRILAAEDNLINQKVLVRMLHSFRFSQIDIVGNGAEAVSMLNDSSGMYDLILMDISMPVMDGFEATAKLRASGVKLPIIAMTAYALAGDMEKVLRNGMDDYIVKPMDRNVLLQKLLKWLDTTG